jgi:hypothetical protein
VRLHPDLIALGAPPLSFRVVNVPLQFPHLNSACLAGHFLFRGRLGKDINPGVSLSLFGVHCRHTPVATAFKLVKSSPMLGEIHRLEEVHVYLKDQADPRSIQESQVPLPIRKGAACPSRSLVASSLLTSRSGDGSVDPGPMFRKRLAWYRVRR